MSPLDQERRSGPPGWDEEWEQAWREEHRAGLVPCRVVRIDKGGITVSADEGDEQLVIAAKAVRRVVVGDVCGLDPDAGRIEQILPRRTVFERRSPGVARDQLQLRARALAANMDRVFVLQPLEPGVNAARLARELVLAWESGAQPVVVLTKADLVDGSHVDAQLEQARRFAPGVDVHAVSNRDPHTLEELRRQHGRGHVIALLGASGAGKSSLVNALAGRPVQLVAEVRSGDQRGRHTTSAGQMVELADGALLIDTPGIRGVGLWSADEGLERAFSDLEPFAQDCRFDDCTHTNEPGCGLLAAVERGEIGADRLEVWQSLVGELEQLEEGLEELKRVEQREVNQRARRKAQRRTRD
jgi:ribosome biogenesis GTPase